jgi:hypothetical protein
MPVHAGKKDEKKVKKNDGWRNDVQKRWLTKEKNEKEKTSRYVRRP